VTSSWFFLSTPLPDISVLSADTKDNWHSLCETRMSSAVVRHCARRSNISSKLSFWNSPLYEVHGPNSWSGDICRKAKNRIKFGKVKWTDNGYVAFFSRSAHFIYLRDVERCSGKAHMTCVHITQASRLLIACRWYLYLGKM